MKKNHKIFWISLLLFSFIIQANTQILSRKISLQAKNEKIISVIKRISTTQNINFSINSGQVPESPLFTGSFQDKPISVILDNLLTGTCLSYKEIKGLIVVYKIDNCVKKSSPQKLAVDKPKHIRDTVIIYDTIIKNKVDTIFIISRDTILIKDTILRIDTCFIEKKKENSIGFFISAFYSPVITKINNYTTLDPEYSYTNGASRYNYSAGVNLGLKYKHSSLSFGFQYLSTYQDFTLKNSFDSIYEKTIQTIHPISKSRIDTISSYYELINGVKKWYYNIDTIEYIENDTSYMNKTDTIENINTSEINKKLQYFIIPLHFSYSFDLGKKFNLAPEAGIAFAFLFRENYITNNINLSKQIVFVDVSLVIKYNLTRYFSILAQPKMSFQINDNLEENQVLTGKTHYFSVGLGLLYNF